MILFWTIDKLWIDGITFYNYVTNENKNSTDIKENLGIVICLDKNQDNLWDLMDKYPLLYNDGNVVWLDRWSDDTLRETPRLIVQRYRRRMKSDSLHLDLKHLVLYTWLMKVGSVFCTVCSFIDIIILLFV